MLKNTLGRVLLLVFAGGDAGRGSTSEALTAAEALRVIKSEHKRHLLRGGEPDKVYSISLGTRPVEYKVQAGDERIPEGRDVIDGRNLESRYHRALHISYPDVRDRRESVRGMDPGGMIMIHGLPDKTQGDPEGYVGMDWTDGCNAVTHAEIEELLRVVKDGTPIDIPP